MFGNEAIKEDDRGTYFLDFEILIENFERVYTNDENLPEVITKIVDIGWPDSISEFVRMRDLLARLSDAMTSRGTQANADRKNLIKMADSHGHYIHALLGEEIYGGFYE